MLRISVLYVIFSGLLTVYLRETLPVQATTGTITFVCTFLLAIGLALSCRLLLARRHKRTLSADFQKEPRAVISLPLRELCSDLVLWILLGSFLGVLSGAPWWTNLHNRRSEPLPGVLTKGKGPGFAIASAAKQSHGIAEQALEIASSLRTSQCHSLACWAGQGFEI